MKSVKNVIRVAGLLILMSAACLASDIVGKWRQTNDGSVWEFFNDGTFANTPKPTAPDSRVYAFPFGGKYTILADGRLKLDCSAMGVVMVETISLKGDILTLTDSQGDTKQLTKLK